MAPSSHRPIDKSDVVAATKDQDPPADPIRTPPPPSGAPPPGEDSALVNQLPADRLVENAPNDSAPPPGDTVSEMLAKAQPSVYDERVAAHGGVAPGMPYGSAPPVEPPVSPNDSLAQLVGTSPLPPPLSEEAYRAEYLQWLSTRSPDLGNQVRFHLGSAICAAFVAHIHEDGQTVNLTYLDESGTPFPAQDVPHGHADNAPRHRHWVWEGE